ncbi:CWF19-like protein 1 isoform X2 [Lingula anatina]|nr:CWF19-like protein 1 isoform X2 [Lingula anatina]|eukprot:XP_013396694.1 CWF19-like protein 1 isoform X2 [Lingula anatina]
MLLCVGDFFGDSDEEFQQYLKGNLKAPISTFILGPSKEHHGDHFKDVNGTELCDNITYLGKKGVFSGSSGLQIAYLCGKEGDESDASHFSSEDLNSIRVPLQTDSSNYKGVDILLTSQWPRGVEKYGSKAEEVDSNTTGSSFIAQLAVDLKPRYHFSGLEGTFYERQPYRNHKVLAESAKHVTRFLALAKVGNKEKKKWLYAMNIVPLNKMNSEELVKQPEDVTECPYKNIPVQAKPKAQEESSTQFFYDMSGGQGKKRPGDKTKGPPEKKQQRKPPQPTGPCWFCLGSPEVEKHLVISIGTQVYLALAKGPLVPEHVLILPIGHYQSTVSLPDDVRSEIEQFKSALKKFYKSLGKAAVFFERNFRTQHLQIQACPIERDHVQDVKQVFDECASFQKLELHEIPKLSDLKQIVPVGAPYFYAELPTGDKLLHRISKNFPLQFGREALASPELLNMLDRVDWRNCKYSKEEETNMAKELRTAFQPFDFNL